ncbi:helicase-like protein [Nocardiopsis sp. Huas11]|uniref:DEAD/DEAH box helicase n=1 Tax=Nocardiopsis sp. Huas11 TaxID=2183912 RepID=UPI000F24B808|nr:DEAD/DEAH box helicase [Nocardiopsis sp. Huas11]RKS07184.1 helicase-like protein [Nocardiopsis sp. Huas11]
MGTERKRLEAGSGSQATYLPDRHMFALWRWADGAVGAAPPVGDVQTVPLVVPTPDLDGLTVSDVDCVLVEPARLMAVPLDAPDRSVRVWRSWIAGDEPALPIAAHAVPDATGVAVTTAEHASDVFRRTASAEAKMRTALTAELRPYQARGVSWLRETIETHGGAVLADEMGLGKTLQTIGCVAERAEKGPQLVVCPTSLVGNWAHEIARFAPGLLATIWRGGPLPEADGGTVVLTGYPTLRTHAPALAGVQWSTAVFDEAQVLKNPRTQVSKTARTIAADARIALTGTPVENHLDELWALLDLVAPHLFGNRTQFRRRFVRPIADGSPAASARLRGAIDPVVLMRKKSQVAGSLPPKIHADLLCDLTEEQERLYDRLLEEVIDDGFGTGAQRQTRVLAALTSLKQVCNHPGLVTDDLGELSGRSGKLDLCTDIVADNLQTQAPTLVFTQYRRTGELLVRHFAERFGASTPFFHGGLNQQQRADIVRRFQSDDGPKVLVLSLKAGGTGLTLTRAADVIHFDRWWNPAVEAQASDRVHRIGQTRPVTVTTLTTGTTVEEHIAAMHDRKSALSDLADMSSVAELARLDDDRLIEVLRRKRVD